MTISKAQQKAVNKYIRERYDRINVTMPKGQKAEIHAFATRRGLSINAYINAAIAEKIAKEAPIE